MFDKFALRASLVRAPVHKNNTALFSLCDVQIYHSVTRVIATDAALPLMMMMMMMMTLVMMNYLCDVTSDVM